MSRFSLLPLLSSFCLLLLIGSCSSSKIEEANPETKGGSWTTCRIWVQVEPGYRLELVVTDTSLIERIAGQPLRDARIDPERKDYLSLGDLELEHTDGKKDTLWLFSPLGHFKKGNTYYITDLTELRKLLQTAHKSREWKKLVGE
jgi:hypothetical protein